MKIQYIITLILLLLTIVIPLIIYFISEKGSSIKLDATYAIVAYVGAVLTGASLGMNLYYLSKRM